MREKLPALRTCRNVGQLIKELEKLPKTLPVHINNSKSVKPIVFNDGAKAKELGLDRCLEICDPEDW